MDIIRAIIMGLGCFGLLVLGSCGMLGFGTVAVMDKAAEIAKEERAAKAIEVAANPEATYGSYERYDRSAADYSESTDEDYSDFGDPSVEIKSND